jgi:hypothetical protein
MKIYTCLVFVIPALLAGCASNKKELKHEMVEARTLPYASAEISCTKARALAKEGQWVQAWQVANAAIGVHTREAEVKAMERGDGSSGMFSTNDCEECYKVMREYLLNAHSATETHLSPAFKE